MKELDPVILLAVFQEMLGPLLWILIAAILMVAIALIGLLVRERTIKSRRFVWSQVIGLFGGVLSLVIMARVSSSGYSDAAGPADWILIVLVFVAGAIATTLTAYSIMGWVRAISAPPPAQN